MQTLWIGRRFHFDASHFLPGHPRCGQVHGHTWTVDIEVKDKVGSDGMVIDFANLKIRINEILGTFDHSSLNNFFTNPTVEHISLYLAAQVKERYPAASAIRVKVQEGEGGWAIAEI